MHHAQGGVSCHQEKIEPENESVEYNMQQSDETSASESDSDRSVTDIAVLDD